MRWWYTPVLGDAAECVYRIDGREGNVAVELVFEVMNDQVFITMGSNRRICRVEVFPIRAGESKCEIRL